MRWNPYILYKNHEVSKFYSSYFAPNSKLLFVLGNGFDVRMNNSILQLRNSLPNFEFDVLLIDIEEDPNSSSHAYQALADQNYKDFNKLTESLNVRRTSIRIWEEEGISKRRVGDKNAADLFSNLSDLQDYSDVIIDISALPRVIYFSLIGKALSLIDNEPNCQINLMVTVSENAKIDSVTNHINPE